MVSDSVRSTLQSAQSVNFEMIVDPREELRSSIASALKLLEQMKGTCSKIIEICSNYRSPSSRSSIAPDMSEHDSDTPKMSARGIQSVTIDDSEVLLGIPVSILSTSAIGNGVHVKLLRADFGFSGNQRTVGRVVNSLKSYSIYEMQTPLHVNLSSVLLQKGSVPCSVFNSSAFSALTKVTSWNMPCYGYIQGYNGVNDRRYSYAVLFSTGVNLHGWPPPSPSLGSKISLPSQFMFSVVSNFSRSIVVTICGGRMVMDEHASSGFFSVESWGDSVEMCYLGNKVYWSVIYGLLNVFMNWDIAIFVTDLRKEIVYNKARLEATVCISLNNSQVFCSILGTLGHYRPLQASSYMLHSVCNVFSLISLSSGTQQYAALIIGLHSWSGQYLVVLEGDHTMSVTDCSSQFQVKDVPLRLPAVVSSRQLQYYFIMPQFFDCLPEPQQDRNYFLVENYQNDLIVSLLLEVRVIATRWRVFQQVKCIFSRMFSYQAEGFVLMISWGNTLLNRVMSLAAHHLHKDDRGVSINSREKGFNRYLQSVDDINWILCTFSGSVADEQLFCSGVYATYFRLSLRVLSSIVMLWLIAGAVGSFLLSGHDVTRPAKTTNKRHVPGCGDAYWGHEYYYEIVTAGNISIRPDHSPFCVGTHINVPLSIEDLKDQLGLVDDFAGDHHTAKLIVLRSFVQVVSAMCYSGRLSGYKFVLRLVLFPCVSTILSEISAVSYYRQALWIDRIQLQFSRNHMPLLNSEVVGILQLGMNKIQFWQEKPSEWHSIVLGKDCTSIVAELAVTTRHLATILSHRQEKYKCYDTGILTQDWYSSFEEGEPNSAECAQKLQVLIARFPIRYFVFSWVLYYHALIKKVAHTLGDKPTTSIEDYDELAKDNHYRCGHLPLRTRETSITVIRISIGIKENLLVSCSPGVAYEELKLLHKEANSTNNFFTMLWAFWEAYRWILRQVFSQLMQPQKGCDDLLCNQHHLVVRAVCEQLAAITHLTWVYSHGPSCCLPGQFKACTMVSKIWLSGYRGIIPTLWRIAWYAKPLFDLTYGFQSMKDAYQLTSLSTDLFLKVGSLVTFLWRIAWSYRFCNTFLLQVLFFYHP